MTLWAYWTSVSGFLSKLFYCLSVELAAMNKKMHIPQGSHHVGCHTALAGPPLFTVYRLIRRLIYVLCFLVTPPLLQRHSRTEHSFTDSEGIAGLITVGIAPTDGWRQPMWMWMFFSFKTLVGNVSSVLGKKITLLHESFWLLCSDRLVKNSIWTWVFCSRCLNAVQAFLPQLINWEKIMWELIGKVIIWKAESIDAGGACVLFYSLTLSYCW